MIVVADTSPLNYLVLVGEDEVLPRLFQRVMVPQEVYEELIHAHAPAQVRHWATSAPDWLEVVPVDVRRTEPIADLDAGEEAAIRLAEQQGTAVFLLMDDAKGRRVAAQRGLRTTGTLGVLQAASRSGLISLQDVLPRLTETNFYAPKGLIDELLKQEMDDRRA